MIQMEDQNDPVVVYNCWHCRGGNASHCSCESDCGREMCAMSDHWTIPAVPQFKAAA